MVLENTPTETYRRTSHANECPNCHGRDAEITVDGGAYDGHEFRCRDCGQEWRAVFKFSHAEVPEQ